MISAAQIQLVQGSWDKARPIQQQAAEIFYARLFELDPSLRPLFKGDMAEQGRKLMTMLNTVVVNLTKLDQLMPQVTALAARHNGYGVKSKDYDTVGNALLSTLEAGLGPAFTPDVRAAWGDAYTTLANVMKQVH